MTLHGLNGGASDKTIDITGFATPCDIEPSLRSRLGRLAMELQWQGLLRELPVAVYITDAAGWTTYYNEAAAKAWGYRPAIGKARYNGALRLFDRAGPRCRTGVFRRKSPCPPLACEACCSNMLPGDPAARSDRRARRKPGGSRFGAEKGEALSPTLPASAGESAGDHRAAGPASKSAPA